MAQALIDGYDGLALPVSQDRQHSRLGAGLRLVALLTFCSLATSVLLGVVMVITLVAVGPSR
jgi:hypothetical protein